MPVWLVLLLGTASGTGLWWLIDGLWPAAPPLAAVLDRLHPKPETPPIVAADAGGWSARLGRPAAGALARLGLPTAGIRADLAVLGRRPDTYLAEKATAGVVGLLLAPLMVLAFAVVGIHISVVIPVWGALGLAAAGFLAPDAAVRTDAARRRTDARHALSAWLDLTTIALAGGAGVEQALAAAAAGGDGWTFTQIRRALAASEAARTPPWQALARRGAEIGVPDLAELAASVQLAGTEGARIRSSLAAKAEALRGRQLSEAEAAAASATERMSLPVVLLFAGFLLFIGYPAVAHILTGL